MSTGDPAVGSPDSFLTLVILPQGDSNEVKGLCLSLSHTYTCTHLTPTTLEVQTILQVSCFPLFISSSFFSLHRKCQPSLLSSLLLVTTQSSLTKSTFNASLGPLVLPDRGGWILAAMCDPTLINRVGEGKGAMHTPIHYFIRMAHSERWSPSLYLNEGDWTRHSVSHPVRLLLSANAQNQPPVFLLCSA